MKVIRYLAPAALTLALSGPLPAQHAGGDQLPAGEQLLALSRAGKTTAALEQIDRRTEVNVTSPDGTTPLHWAVYHGDRTLVEQLLERGADPTARNEFGASPLSEAAIQADPELIGLLLEAGADPNERGADDQTPLMIVARTDRTEAARLLLDAGADPDAREKWRGQTALMWAAAQSRPEMIQALIDHGADPDIHSERTDFVRQVTAEPRIKVLPTGALTPLLYAAREGCAACVENLLKGGADPELTDPDEISPLIMATLNANWDAAKVLLNHGANPDKWDWWGRTPLYAAVDLNTVPRGGRPDRPSTDETTGTEIIEMLLEAGANPDAQLKLFPPYRALGADRGADGILTTGATPLHRAARGADIDAVSLLLEYGADANLPTAAGISPLMAASGFRASSIDTRGRLRTADQALETTQLLLDRTDIDINHQENFGQTALHGAAAQGYTPIVELLLARGADPFIKDQNDSTAQDHAMGRGARFGRGGGGGTAHPETGALLEQAMAESRDGAEEVP